jgi:predicted amidohydrolase YtcJ
VRTLYLNGTVYAPGRPTALMVDGERIAWLGDDDGARALSAERTVDLDGALLAPAFVDAHVHVTDTGLSLIGLDLSQATSRSEVLDLVERQGRTGRGRPILGRGWDDSAWPDGRPPTSAELDRASYGGAVYLARVDAHAAVVSSALLAAVPSADKLPGYGRDGLVTLEAHHALRSAAYGSITRAQRRDAQRATRARAAQLGIGCLQEMAGPEVSSEDDLLDLLRLGADEPGPEIIAYWGELLAIEKAIELGAVGAGGDLFCDGSLGAHTAALNQPYDDRPGDCGQLRFAVDQVREHISRSARAGRQAGFHAIGDAAIDQILDALDQIRATEGPSAALGHRIEHAEMVDDPARFGAAGLTASMQPAFEATWGGDGGMYASRIGAPRTASMNRFAQLVAAGTPLAFGSDAPVTALDPWAAVQAAAYPRESSAAISPRAAFLAHTRGGWRAARADGDGSGTLTPGAPATIAIWSSGGVTVDAPDERVARWSTDPEAAVAGLPDLSPGTPRPTCLATLVRGQPVFDAEVL